MNDLSKESFRVLEDGVEQKITSFLWEEEPVSLGLLFDSSGSIEKPNRSLRYRAEKRISDEPYSGDEFFLVQFSDDVRLLSDSQPNPIRSSGDSESIQASGWTALLDAIALGTNQLRAAKNARKVLLILSDGNDNNSRFTESELRNRVVEADVRIYAIAVIVSAASAATAGGGNGR